MLHVGDTKFRRCSAILNCRWKLPEVLSYICNCIAYMQRHILIGQLPWDIFAWCSAHRSMGQPRNVAATWPKRWSIHESTCICICIFQHAVCRFRNGHQRRISGASWGCDLEICGVKRGVNSNISRLLKRRQFIHEKLTTTILSRMEAILTVGCAMPFQVEPPTKGPSEWQWEEPFSCLRTSLQPRMEFDLVSIVPSF